MSDGESATMSSGKYSQKLAEEGLAQRAVGK